MVWACLSLACAAQGQDLPRPEFGRLTDSDCPSVPWRSISPAVWAWMPDERDPRSPPQPIAAVVDEGQAMLIDPGPSAAHGVQAQRSLACRFQAGLRWVVLTHGDPESVRGLQGLTLADAAQVRAPAAIVRRLAEGCAVCGVEAGRVKPGESELQAGQTLPVGRLQLQVLAVYKAHSPGDALLWLGPQGVLWAGGLIDRQPLPEASRAEPSAWLQALQRVDEQAQHPEQAVRHLMAHGHWAGVADVRAAVEGTRQALLDLQTQVQQALQQGRLPDEIVAEAERSHWPADLPRAPALLARQRANVQRMVQVLEIREPQAGSMPQGVRR